MEYVYAALLLHSADKNVDEDGIRKVVEAAGVAVDDVRIKALVSALEGVDIGDVLSKAAAMPVAVAAAPAAGAAAPAAGAAAPDEEEKKEVEEEAAIEGLGALFG